MTFRNVSRNNHDISLLECCKRLVTVLALCTTSEQNIQCHCAPDRRRPLAKVTCFCVGAIWEITLYLPDYRSFEIFMFDISEMEPNFKAAWMTVALLTAVILIVLLAVRRYCHCSQPSVLSLKVEKPCYQADYRHLRLFRIRLNFTLMRTISLAYLTPKNPQWINAELGAYPILSRISKITL